MGAILVILMGLGFIITAVVVISVPIAILGGLMTGTGIVFLVEDLI